MARGDAERRPEPFMKNLDRFVKPARIPGRGLNDVETVWQGGEFAI
jgi:hypothetical protein